MRAEALASLHALREGKRRLASEIQELEHRVSCGEWLESFEERYSQLAGALEEARRAAGIHALAQRPLYGLVTAAQGELANAGYITDIAYSSAEIASALPLYWDDLERVCSRFHAERGHQYLREGAIDQALSEWREALRLRPCCARARQGLAMLADPRAELLLEQTRFEEDVGFGEALGSRWPAAQFRCIAFDDEQSLYLNEITSWSVIKLSRQGAVEWEIDAGEWASSLGGRAQIGFGSMRWFGDRLGVCDILGQVLVSISKQGSIEEVTPIPMKAPGCVEFVPLTRSYHVCDEFAGVAEIYDEAMSPVKRYQSPGPLWRPVQALLSGDGEHMLVSFGMGRARSLLAEYDLAGNFVRELTRFEGAPAHATKIAPDPRGGAFVLDHFGRIYRIDREGGVVWKHAESERVDRFRYGVLQGDALYISDSYKLRRFRV